MKSKIRSVINPSTHVERGAMEKRIGKDIISYKSHK